MKAKLVVLMVLALACCVFTDCSAASDRGFIDNEYAKVQELGIKGKLDFTDTDKIRITIVKEEGSDYHIFLDPAHFVYEKKCGPVWKEIFDTRKAASVLYNLPYDPNPEGDYTIDQDLSFLGLEKGMYRIKLFPVKFEEEDEKSHVMALHFRY